jgi:F-type H+-transporting ATPase subunit delta
MIDAVAHIYAEALIQLAFEKGVPAEVLRDLEEVARLLREDPRAFTFLVTPNIRKEAKRQVIDRAFGGRVSEVVQNFLKVAIDKGRAAEIPSIIEAFKQAYHERQGELVVKIAAAQPLEDDERKRVRDALLKRFRNAGVNDVVLEEKVDGALLGGLVVRTGDQVFDGSLRSRLAALGDKLKMARLKTERVYEG